MSGGGDRGQERIAIVGMAGRFPRAAGLPQLWRNLRDGVDCISRYSAAELLAAGVEPRLVADPRYVPAQGRLEECDLFDAAFFGFSAREAELTDPQHRLFLETCWHALEDAGHDPARVPGQVGVFASASSNLYLYHLHAQPEVVERMGELRTHLGNGREFMPAWVSFKLDLKGPSVNVQTACSSSLVAVHLACQSLLDGECDLALAGGVCVRNFAPGGYLYQPGGILSPDGRCCAFGAQAQGTVGGDGVGVVVLRRLDQALAAGDPVRAVIRGSAINNDGWGKIGFTAPGLAGQTRVIAEALAVAGVDPSTVSYVEAHGTGTPAGDPIEIAALAEAFRGKTAAIGFCGVGSVKSNLGHLDAAAGIAGLLKTVLALVHAELPPSLHCSAPNPAIDFANSPFRVQARLAPWPRGSTPRRAGVSSFGIGGTNAHVVLEEAPPPPVASPARSWQLLVFSARTPAALTAATACLARTLDDAGADLDLAGIACTLQCGRHGFAHRAAAACRDLVGARAALAEGGRRGPLVKGERRDLQVAFLLPGQGEQRVGMGRALYDEWPVFRAEVDLCAELLAPHLELDLREVLYPAGDDAAAAAARRLEQTAWAQPALFVFSYALARLWISWGVRPQALLGHSLGEVVAACLAGTFDLEDALALVAARGRLLQALPPGGMLALPLGEAEVLPWLEGGLGLAAVNGERRTVVAGPPAALDELERRLAEKGIQGRRLPVAHAFHSPMMDPVVPRLAELVRRARPRAPRIPYLSNLTGGWITADQAADAESWARQLHAPVRFGSALDALLAGGPWLLLEVGPSASLGGLVRRHPLSGRGHVVVSSLDRAAGGEAEALMAALGRAWVAGAGVAWEEIWRGERTRRVSLPGYPFERRRYWSGGAIRSRPPGPAVAEPVAAEEAAAFPVEVVPGDKEMFMPDVAVAGPQRRWREAILGVLWEMVRDLSGTQPVTIDETSSFLEIGVDSLLLIQVGQWLERRFRVKVSLVQLLEELTSLATVADYLERELSEESLRELLPLAAPEVTVAISTVVSTAMPAPTAAADAAASAAAVPALIAAPAAAAPALAAPAGQAWATAVAAPAPAAAGAGSSTVERILLDQMRLLTLQLQVLGSDRSVAAGAAAGTLLGAPPAPAATVTEPSPAPPSPAAGFARFGPYRPLEVGAKGGLTSRQQAHLDALIARYTARTPRSKALAQEHRRALADGRASFGFRRHWKELIYPIAGQTSKGSRLRDVDDNEYVDICMGFGLHMFGHSPDFLLEAMQGQIRQGLELGPQSPLAGRVAALICELTGMERCAFCNSGTEAVMGALRVARTATRRSKIAMFAGSYHGWSDGTLARAQTVSGQTASVPVAPGVSAAALRDVMVLELDRPESLAALAAHGAELAAVLVEPVRSRDPEHQPREFLHRVRELTARTGSVLIFDEMVTGFRIHLGGAQAWYGIEADLATYGKLIAGGLPIGVVAGRARYMDMLDGGMWSFGDDSYPTAEKTMFAGAFFKHPLTMAVALAVLERLKSEGPGLQARLGERTTAMAGRINRGFAAAGVPIEVVSCGPLFRFRFARELQQFADLFSYHLLEKGIFYGVESGNCFLTPAHGDEDIALIESAVRRSVEELQGAGFLPGGEGGLPGGGPGRERRQTAAPLPVAAAETMSTSPSPRAAHGTAVAPASRPIDLSLYYFGSYEPAYDPDKYRLLLAGVEFADQHGFTAVWLPERHFHSFGGLSPNPAVVAAALAVRTRRLQLRAGSVVLPLHHPIRVAEEWSVVDNLSHGRVGVAFASGWHADDFALAPAAYEKRRAVMYEAIEAVRSLWRGEPLRVQNGEGKEMSARLHPLPKQPELPLWLTAASDATYQRAGSMGVGVLTNLQTQSIEELERKLGLYYQSLDEHGHGRGAAKVAVLMHTFVGTDLDEARRRAGAPLREYLRSSFALTRRLVETRGQDIDFAKLAPGELDYLLARAADRYMSERSLIGTPLSCRAMLDRMAAIGVTEIGCLIDFGIETDSMLASLPHLAALVAAPAASPAVLAAAGSREVATTEAQRSLWLASQIGRDAALAYNEPVVLRLSGPLDATVIRRALQRVVDRHGALRATFSADGTRQRIAAACTSLLPLIDLSGLDEAARAKAVAGWLEGEARRSFDLEHGPLLRCGLARLRQQEHYLFLLPYHLILDGHSLGVLLRELSQFYTAERRGEPYAPADVEAIEETVRRQAIAQAEAGLAEAEAYWTGLFEGDIPRLALPTDRPHPPVPSYRGALRSRGLPAALTAELRQLGSRRGATLFMTLLSAFGLMLHRLSGQDDVVVGVASQDPAAAGAVMGYFLNLLPLRLRLDGAPTFPEYLMRTRRRLLEAQVHRSYTLAQLVRKLNPPRDRGRSLVEANLNLDRAGEPLHFADLAVEMVRVHPGAIVFDLRFNLTEVGAGLLLEAHTRSELFDPATAERIISWFEELLRAIAARPDAAVGELHLLGETERHQLLREWNDSASGRVGEPTVTELFAAQVAWAPRATAVAWAGGAVSYAELDAAAGRLARRLRRLGVGPEVRVAVCLRRSPALVAAVLGVLRAGGAYVPLDPSYPVARLHWMLDDALGGLPRPVLVSDDECLAHLAPLPPLPPAVLRLDAAELGADGATEGGEDALEGGVAAPLPSAGPDQLAYVLYTSGSTGRPKGVMVHHRGLANYLAWCLAAYPLAPGTAVPLHSSIGFDLTVTSLLAPLAAGAAVVVLPEHDEMPALAAALVRGESYSLVKLTPSHLRLLTQLLPPAGGDAGAAGAAAGAVGMLVLGGEALFAGDLAAFRQRAPASRVVNEYGPTETVVGCATEEIGAGLPGAGPVPIGRPIRNLRLHLLDAELRACPLGGRGEICIGGHGVARGYLGRPELTAERFVPDPCARPGDGAGGRLYRSGDLGRHLPDGRLEYLGRLDQQVKVRGYRIELGEIEAVLAAAPGVRKAAVVLREGADGGLLLGCVVPRKGVTPSVEELRQFLAARLPEPMIPAQFVSLGRLPLTTHGKVDRQALAGLQPPARAADAAAPGPRTASEELLAGLFAEVLGLQRLGMEDSFFALGGHSLLATQLISRVRAVFAVELALREIFGEPTVRGLARTIAAAAGSGGLQPRLPPLRPVPRSGPLPLSFAQQRLWLLNRLQPGDTAYNLAAAVRLSGRLDRPALARALAEVVRRHEVLRTTFAVAEGDPVQVIAEGWRPRLPLLDLRGLPASRRRPEAGRLAHAAALRPFDLAAGPLLRPALAALADDEHVFQLILHHVVADGWSIGLLIGELSACYGRGGAAAAPPLPELPVQYADFAVWQRSWLCGELLAGELAAWRELLAGSSPLLELPTDRPRPAVRSSAGAIRPVAFSAAELAGFEAFSRRQGVTLFMTLLAGLATVLSRWSGHERVAIGTPIAGRNHLATESLVGFFVNTLVLPVEVAADSCFGGLLGRVRTTALAAYAHQDLPFEKLIEELQPERDLSRTPLFQTMFALQNTPARQLVIPGLQVEALAVESGTERFDLTLFLAQVDGRLGGALSYRTDLFDAATAERLAGHLRELLAAAVAHPDVAPAALPLLAPAERQALRVEWNDTAAAAAAPPPLPELIAAQAARTPAAVAVEGAGQALSYRDLDQRANQLAHHLSRRGVGPGTRVGVLVGRSPEAVVAVLGVLRAGAAYVPLDPGDPALRLGAVVEDARLGLLLAEGELGEELALPATRRLRLDAERAAIAGESAAAPAIPLDPGQLAYVIYTSGSTGSPKGVQIAHGALSNLLLCLRERLGVTAADRLLAVTTLSFDIAMLELFLPLLAGGTLVVAGRDEAADGQRLGELLVGSRVTVMQATPATWRLLGEAGWEGGRGLLALCGGELLPRPLAARLGAGVRCLWHLYGPTEATIWSTAGRVRTGEGPVPLGRPLANTEAHVLDAALAPLPVGVEGDLYLGGSGLAWGYLGRPDVTAASFLPHPFAARPGERLYRTGDRARRLPDGDLVFHGRRDQQVKLHGFRIELGEIEAALAAVPAVQEAAVIVQGEGAATRLAAFVVPAAGSTASVEQVRQGLGRRLPRHMMPATIVLTPALPRTANGKLDRRALAQLTPAAAPVPAGAGAGQSRPHTVTELALVQLWEELLEARPIGAEDSFFDLGGHSLLAVRLMMRMKARWGWDLPQSTLFEHPTVRGLARCIERQAGPRPWSPLVAVQPHGSLLPLYFVHPIGGQVLCFYHLAQHLGLDRPFFGLQAQPLSAAGGSLSASIEQMAADYVVAIRKARPAGPYLIGGWSFGGLVAYEMAQQLRLLGETVPVLVLLDTNAPVGRDAPELETSVLVALLAREQARENGRELALSADQLRGLPLTEQLGTVLRRFREELNLDRAEVDLPFLERLIEGHRARHRAFEEYRPVAYAGRIALFRPHQVDDELVREAPEPLRRRLLDPAMGWRDLAAGTLEIHPVPGFHETLALPPHVAQLAAVLRAELAAAESDGPEVPKAPALAGTTSWPGGGWSAADPGPRQGAGGP